jgi:hypothetical protein
MERLWGPPQPTAEEIDPRVSAEAERTVPEVWFLVNAQGRPNNPLQQTAGASNGFEIRSSPSPRGC